ncbi:NUC189-domain-containing protein [Trametes meyenii]|nr:NUC189-domain-containing protein [Trametes meyenii]
MAPSPEKSKKSRAKPPRGRPAATSAISQPAVEDATTSTYLSSFSPDGKLFAFLSLTIDKHALKVYDTATRRHVAAHVVDAARVTSLCWARLDLAEGQGKDAGAEDASRKSKRKKRNSLAAEADAATPGTAVPQLVVLGLSDGSLLLFSPSHGRLLRTLSDPSSSTAVLAVTGQHSESEDPHTIWTSSSDGALRLWNARTNQIALSHFGDDRIPYTALSVRRSDEEGLTEVLAAHHSIHLLAFSSDSLKPKIVAKFTGHASPVSALQWADRGQFVSSATTDRFINVWEVPAAPKTEGKIVATIPLDSDVRAISLSQFSSSLSSQQVLFTLSAAGKVSVFTLASDLATSSPAKGKSAIPTLIPKSVITPSSKKSTGALSVLSVSYSDDVAGRVRIASVTGGVQLAFDTVEFRDQSEHFIPDVAVTVATADATVGQIEGKEGPGAPNKRYNESASLAIGTGAEIGQDRELDDLIMRDVDGALDADLAELSLGQRLTAVQGGDPQASGSDSDSEKDETAVPNGKTRKGAPVDAVPASSLTRTLIQALHSSDSRLLETCLAHSDPTLIRNTVRRLPPQLAVPLVTSCVERLSRGARGNNLKGGGGGASSQRGTALINWVKAVLTAHSGHLMTMPDLVARLSGLHAVLAQRLTLQDSLLSLSGRLDMVISQIELRSSGPPAPLPMPKNKRTRNKQAKAREARQYVEGESEDDEEQMEVEVESADEEGSVEDVELGGESESEGEGDSIEETDDEEDEDEDDDGDDPTLGGFIDDEAEEYSEDEDEEESD